MQSGTNTRDIVGGLYRVKNPVYQWKKIMCHMSITGNRVFYCWDWTYKQMRRTTLHIPLLTKAHDVVEFSQLMIHFNGREWATGADFHLDVKFYEKFSFPKCPGLKHFCWFTSFISPFYKKGDPSSKYFEAGTSSQSVSGAQSYGCSFFAAYCSCLTVCAGHTCHQ